MTDTNEHRGHHLMVKSDVAADGTYTACVEVGEDQAFPLDRQRAQAYAVAVLTAAMHAEHDAAVVAQFLAIGLTQDHATQAIAVMRQRRLPVDDAATEPLQFIPGVSLFTGDPFIHLLLEGKAFCQLRPADAVEHALYVLRILTAADVDGVYYRYLAQDLDLPEGNARATVADIGRYYQESSK